MDERHHAPGEPGWRAGLPVGRLRGAPLRISPLWAGAVAVVTVLYPGIAQRLVPGAGAVGSHLISFALGVQLLLSVLVHEIGHLVGCWVAGVPVRSVVLSVAGNSVEHDVSATARQAAIVAAGGPAASLALAGLCAVPAGLTGGPLAAVLGAPVVGNLVISVGTLLPGLPTDGGELVAAAVWAATGSAATGERVAGRMGRTLAVAVVLGALLFARTDNPIASGAALVAGFLVAVYLWRGAGRSRAGVPASGWAVARAWTLVGVLSVVSIVLVRSFVVQSMVVVSDSMDGTLSTGDRVVMDKLSVELFGVRRGEVVVLRRPGGVHAPAGDLVKRVIGLPGDRLTERGGRVARNGITLVEPYLRPGCADDAAGLDSVVVPAGTVYVMGDNRCHSLDSRSFGPVDQNLVAGRVAAIVWPVRRFGMVGGG